MIGITLYLSICLSNIGYCCDFHIESLHFFFHIGYCFSFRSSAEEKENTAGFIIIIIIIISSSSSSSVVVVVVVL